VIFTPLKFRTNIMVFPGALISGLAIYLIFSYLFIPFKVTAPVSVIIFLLVFGLTKYYAVDTSSNGSSTTKSTSHPTVTTTIGTVDKYISTTKRPVADKVVSSKSKIYDNRQGKVENTKRSTEKNIHLTNIFFVLTYILALLIVLIGSFFSSTLSPNLGEIEALKLFVPWQQQFSSIDTIIKLGAAIALSFFLPGYAVVSSVILTGAKKKVEGSSSSHDNSKRGKTLTLAVPARPRSKSLLKVLLGYILSLFITGLAGYIVASFGIPVSGINIILPLFVIYAIILVVFILRTKTLPNDKEIFKFALIGISNFKALVRAPYFIRKYGNNASDNYIRPEVILVFASLFALVILSTYYLYGGIIIGDQWFHHGRALLFISGTFRDIANSSQDDLYPPFLSAFLAAFISLSGNPSVNAYASIGFLNIVPVFAFYYFFIRWFGISSNNSGINKYNNRNNAVPRRLRRDAALLACTLFVLSGGFGWVYAISTAVSSSSVLHHPAITSYASSLGILHLVSVKTFDITQPSNFNLVAHPDFSTGLQLIVLPVGFVLLGLLKEERGELEGEGEQQIKKNCMRNKSKIDYFVIVTVISLLGILSHDEIYLFVIIVSTIPIIFDLPKKHFVYAAFLAAIAITFLINHVYVEDYYTSTLIVGVPLLYLSFLFVAFTWAVYVGKIYFSKFFSTRRTSYRVNKFLIFNRLLKNLVDRVSLSYSIRFRIKIAIGIAIVLVVAYWYVFTFIVWAQIPLKEVLLQTSGDHLNVPWYLFPMKLGLIGIIGLAFIISYFFKKFQKEVFVFGIIVIIALFAGPYYDEHRTSKYIMVGMVGFASLLIYKIVSNMVTTTNITQKITSASLLSGTELRIGSKNNKQPAQLRTPLICGLIIGSVIISSSISVLLFIGYHASALETHNFKLALLRRDFPSSSELNMFRFLDKNNNLINTKTYNIALMPDQGPFNQSMSIKKLQGFTGLPQNMLAKAAAALDASTLEGFYNLLNSSKSQFIILPKKYFNTTKIGFSSDIIRFAAENYKKIYQDTDRFVLKVPHAVTASSSKSNVGLIYQKSIFSLLPSISYAKVLLYNNDSFKKIDSNKFVKADADKKNAILYADKKITTLWSKVMQKQNISYIEANFRISSENKTKNIPDYCGIAWDDGHNKYYTRLMKHALETSQIPANEESRNNTGKALVQNQDIIREKGIWYSLKIAFLKDTINVYINNLLKQKIPRILFENRPIVKVGISCSNNRGEFEPIKIGRIYDLSDRYNQKEIYYDNYYPLNALALSNTGYDTFRDGDYSAFSKRNVILTFDPTEKDDVNRYLEYVKRGGNLIILNSDNKFQGGFSKLLAIQAGNSSKFDGFLLSDSKNQQPLKISGNTTFIESKDANISSLSFYVNEKNETVSPLALQKKYQEGRVIFVNTGGFFDAIFTHPNQYFSSLSNFPKMIGIQSNNYGKINPLNSVSSQPTLRYVGDLTMSGQVIINSSSLSLTNGSDNVPLYVDSVNITTNNKKDNNRINNNNTSSYEHYVSKELSFKNIVIKNLTLAGSYQAIISSGNGPVHMPLPLSRDYYIGISVPKDFDMTVKLLDGASVEFTYGNDNHYYTSDQEIHFHKIKNVIPGSSSIFVLTKNPGITVYGKANLNEWSSGKIVPMHLTGKLKAEIDHVNYYGITNSHALDYLTYLKWINGEANTTTSTVQVALPGTLKNGVVNWKEIIFLEDSITTKLLNIFFVMAIIGVWVLWPKIKPY
jgi:hypothetical protein